MTAAPHHIAVTITTGSMKMYSMQEALARERMSEMHRQARERRAASQARAERRRRRLEQLARSAHRRSSSRER
jgi:hypothetical protein